MAKRPAEQPTRTTLQPTDWINGFIGTNPANPEAGATDFKTQLSNLTNFVLRLVVSSRVNQGGTLASSKNGRVPLSVSRPSTGVYTLTNAENRPFEAITCAPMDTPSGRTYTVEGLSTPTVTVRWFNSVDAPANNAFTIVGELGDT